ncbi:acyltransferase family protein [Eubacteriales bacterium OttesenSCG-928-M02]|nr:acyltransferase family protein [Eubacteriales bacterium OttesenSCG-928-M02]
MKESRQFQRNSSIELLRIISMIMIVFHHFAVHGGFEWEASSITIPHFWYNLIRMGGTIGVDLFVLISGYFLINSKGSSFNFPRILKFWGQVFFYSVLIYVVFSLCGFIDFGITSLIKTMFPITFSTWWFPSTYFVLFLIHPYINKLLHCLDKKNYQYFLIMLVVFWSIIPTFTSSAFQGNSLLWFITLYAIAGYARNYGFNNKFTPKIYFGLWGIFSILTYLSSVLFIVMGNRWNIFFSKATYFFGQEKLSVLLISLSLFMAFVTMKMNYHRWINTIASATFGVYLIHDSKIIRQFLWIDLFKNGQYQESLMIIPYSIVVVAVVYIVCTIIDLIRQKVFEKPFMIVVNKYSESWLKPYKKIINICRNIVFGKEDT